MASINSTKFSYAGGPPSKRFKVGGENYISKLQVTEGNSAVPASQEGVKQPCEEKEGEKKKKGNFQISKRWYLGESGLSLTLCYDEEEIAMFIGNLKGLCNGLRLPLLKFAPHVIMTILNEWSVFHQMYNSKKPCTMVIPKENDEKTSETTMILCTFENKYGMKMITHNSIEGDVELFLDIEGLEKITKAHRFIAQHFEYLLEHLDSYTLMCQEILKKVEQMSGRNADEDNENDENDETACREMAAVMAMSDASKMIVKLDLKKDIIEAFETERQRRGLICDINVYSLFSLCMSVIMHS